MGYERELSEAVLRYAPSGGVLVAGRCEGALAALLRLSGRGPDALALEPEDAALTASFGARVVERLDSPDAASGTYAAVVFPQGLSVLADPASSLAALAKRLSPDGVLVAIAEGAGTAETLLAGAGLGACVAASQNVIVAGASRPVPKDPAAVAQTLGASPDGRSALCLLEALREADEARRGLEAAQTGAGARDAGLEGALKEMASGWIAEARLPSLINKTLGRMGRFNWFFVKLSKYGLRERGRFLPRPEGGDPANMLVAVDLTPVLPGGDNGGAKLLTVNLLLELRALRPGWSFVCLTADASHEELAYLDGPNMERVKASGLGKLRGFSSHKGRKADLLFCPFTMPYFYDPGVPVVSIVYDLQYAYYPQFFSSEEEAGREKTFLTTARRAAKLVCISEFVRGTVLEKGNVPPSRVHTVHIGLPARLSGQPSGDVSALMDRLGLTRERYLLYPANFWAHKNHEMLLTAFGMYLAQYPDSDLRLVLTGADTGKRRELAEAAGRMGLDGRVVFPGYVSDADMGALTQACAALIFPSLFEGFGMPLIEAMTLGRPVLCSNVTSLPEVGGDAALYFDPRRPDEIVAAIRRLETEPGLGADMIRKGFSQAEAIGGPRKMAESYAAIFEEAVSRPLPQSYAVRGVDGEGFAKSRIFAGFGPGAHRQWLELDVALPADAVVPGAGFTAVVNGKPVKAGRLVPGKRESLTLELAPYGGYAEILIDPEPAPGFPGGKRGSGVKVERLVLTDGRQGYDLLPGEGNRL